MRERVLSKHGTRPRTRSVVITVLALYTPVSSALAQEAVDARIQALERQMEEMRRTMQSMEAELEALRKAPPARSGRGADTGPADGAAVGGA